MYKNDECHRLVTTIPTHFPMRVLISSRVHIQLLFQQKYLNKNLHFRTQSEKLTKGKPFHYLLESVVQSSKKPASSIVNGQLLWVYLTAKMMYLFNYNAWMLLRHTFCQLSCNLHLIKHLRKYLSISKYNKLYTLLAFTLINSFSQFKALIS